MLLAKPPLTEDEVRWHKGVRRDNLNTPSRGHGSPPGHRFFADDADPFGLESLLAAACFLDAGEAWVPRLPTEGPGPGKRVRDPELLPEEARRVLENLIRGEEEEAEAGAEAEAAAGGGGGGGASASKRLLRGERSPRTPPPHYKCEPRGGT